MNCPFCNKTTITKSTQTLIIWKECINHEISVIFYPIIKAIILKTKKYSLSIYNDRTHLYIHDPSPTKMINFKFKVNVTPDTFDLTVSKLLKLKAYY